MHAHFFLAAFFLEVFFSFIFSHKKVLFNKLKEVNQSTSCEANHNITNFDLKQKVFENWPKVKINDFNEENNCFPWSIVHDNYIENGGENKTIDLKMLIKYKETIY